MSDEVIIEYITSKLKIFKDFSRLASPPKIKFSKNETTITISLDIIVYFGVNIPQLCYDIQSKIKRYVEKTTKLNVKSIDIHVEGIDKSL
ncbi:MAG TPA: Asp23/Gls24 family envelope stress response protein [Mogibacterium sp.]|nr:Asp23/Gls24 family envelope stress response protein [Mogibacterium sp.]